MVRENLQREQTSCSVLWIVTIQSGERGEVTYQHIKKRNCLLVNGEPLIQRHGVWTRKWHDPSSVFWRLIKCCYVLDYLNEEVRADQDRSLTQLTSSWNRNGEVSSSTRYLSHDRSNGRSVRCWLSDCCVPYPGITA